MRKTHFLLGLALLLPAALFAADESWVVGTRNVPPFAIKQADGTWTGLSVELWDAAARDLGIAYTWREIATPELMVAGVADGSLNAAVAALSVTPERSERVDFSQPFYDSGLAIAVARRESGWSRVMRSLFSLAFLKAVAALAGVLLLAAGAVWFFERKRNAEQFGGTTAEGLGQAFWWSAVTMTTVGYGDKAPQTVAGRLVALVWMFTSIIIISGFTATIASALTAASVSERTVTERELPNVLSATVTGSTAATYLDERNARHRDFGDVDGALAALANGTVEAVVYDEPILRYRLRERDDLVVLPAVFEKQGYAIALPLGDPRRKNINIELLRRLQSDWWSERREAYLGR